MGLLSVIFNQPTLAQIGVLTLDASINETHKRSSIVTENEIEDGTSVQDHIKLNPISFNIEGIISSNPVNLTETLSGTVTTTAAGVIQDIIPKSTFGGLVSKSVGTGLGSLAGLVTGTPKDPRVAFQYLEELWFKRETFTVITALKRYEDMAIETLDVPRNASIGESLKFTISCKQIRKVQSVIVKVPAFKLGADVGKSGSSNVEKGKQSTETPKPKTVEKQSSILNDWVYGGR
jgi:hypothetical protein